MKSISQFVAGAAASRRSIFLVLAVLGIASPPGPLRAAQQSPPDQAPAVAPMEHATVAATPLAVLIEEAEKNDPVILVATQAARAATHVAPQVTALPDPQFTLQQFSVGSPRPFAGFSNSDFAYIGFGASQEFPYPGKRQLRGAIAGRDARAAMESAETARREEIEKLKAAYFRLAYLQQSTAILEHHDILMQQVADIAEARYRVGQGNQQDVLRARLQHTKILYDISMNRQSAGDAQAELKRILRRSQDSTDVIAEPLGVTPLRHPASELFALVREQNSSVRERGEMVRKSQAEVDLARREFRPDFGLSYMVQHTASNYRDYYMLTFDVKFPRRKPREAALAEATINVERARQEQDAELQQALAGVQRQIVTAQTSEEQARIYREGLIPQAHAGYEAGMATYQTGRQDFTAVLSSFLDVVQMELEYQRTLLEHEMAIARIENLTGAALP
jgi:cobalt-zinc-cadmium efflux system outer membrane protein